MMRYLLRIGFTLLVIAAAIAPAARAEGIIAGPTALPGEAIQDITLLPGTPFNPTGSSILISGVTGYATITLNRDAEDPNTNTITIGSLAGGMFYGSNPNLGSYVFGNIAPLTGRTSAASSPMLCRIRTTPVSRPASLPASSPEISRSAAPASGSSSCPGRRRGSRSSPTRPCPSPSPRHSMGCPPHPVQS